MRAETVTDFGYVMNRNVVFLKQSVWFWYTVS